MRRGRPRRPELPLADFHRVIISTALQAARAAGFTDIALGGGNALIVCRGSTRPTRDVDFFCRKPSGLPAIAAVIIEAFQAAGYQVAPCESETNSWDEEAAEGELVELTVSAPDGEAEVQIAHFFYAEDADVPGLGAVLSLPDLGGRKTTVVPLTELPAPGASCGTTPRRIRHGDVRGAAALGKLAA